MQAYFLDEAYGWGPIGQYLSLVQVEQKFLDLFWSIPGHVCNIFGTCFKCIKLLRTPLCSEAEYLESC